jgi:hypothetical protein
VFFTDAISVRDLPAQLKFKDAQEEIARLLKQAADQEKLGRLQTLHQEQFQHRLIHSAELGKIALLEYEPIHRFTGIY